MTLIIGPIGVRAEKLIERLIGCHEQFTMTGLSGSTAAACKWATFIVLTSRISEPCCVPTAEWDSPGGGYIQITYVGRMSPLRLDVSSLQMDDIRCANTQNYRAILCSIGIPAPILSW